MRIDTAEGQTNQDPSTRQVTKNTLFMTIRDDFHSKLEATERHQLI